jgi:hypothetical protein
MSAADVGGHRRPVRHADVVGVDAGHHLLRAGGQPCLERLAEPEVAFQAHEPSRYRRRGNQLGEAAGQLGRHRAVLHEHHLVGRPGLLVHRAGEGAAQEVRPVLGVHSHEQAERQLARGAHGRRR